MSKKIYILVGIVVIAAAAAFVLTREEDPQVKLAKEEIRQAEAVFNEFQNKANAIPALELSQDVKNDFKMEAAYAGLLGTLDPNQEGLSPASMVFVGKLLTAANARGSAKLSFDLEKDFGETLKTAIAIAEVAREDLGFLEKTANAFDQAVKQAKSATPQLTPLSMERNKKTDKYFLEFDRVDQRLKALAASLDTYTGSDFRPRIKKLKSANDTFEAVAKYLYQLFSGKGWLYGLEVAKTFPEVAKEEAAVRNCAKYDPKVAPTGCEPAGFMPGQFQPMLKKLADVYSGLIE